MFLFNSIFYVIIKDCQFLCPFFDSFFGSFFESFFDYFVSLGILIGFIVCTCPFYISSFFSGGFSSLFSYFSSSCSMSISFSISFSKESTCFNNMWDIFASESISGWTVKQKVIWDKKSLNFLVYSSWRENLFCNSSIFSWISSF